MLQITIPAREQFDEVRGEFIYTPSQTLRLEHSLVSISEWEAKWQKPFLTKEEKTTNEVLDYVRCMTLNEGVDPNIYTCLSAENVKEINDYISSPRSATTFREEKKSGGREIITSELIYYWMVSLTIPFECQYWHLNRLLNLVKICNIKNEPPKKMSKGALMRRNSALNAQRRAQMNTKG